MATKYLDLVRTEYHCEEIDEEDIIDFLDVAEKLGWTLEAINDEEVAGRCENCRIPVMVGSDYSMDLEDGVILCKECADDLQRTNN